MAVVLFGGAFDPPHAGHVAIAAAREGAVRAPASSCSCRSGPGTRTSTCPADVRLELARAAFPDDEVRLDPYPRTIDLLRGERFDDPVFLVGADQFVDFLTWKEPEAVLELARLAVATRPGFDRGLLDTVLAQPRAPRAGRRFFDIEPNPAASRDIRAARGRRRAARGPRPSGRGAAHPRARALRGRLTSASPG